MKQSDFALALLNPQTPAPQGITVNRNVDLTRRFAIYRNNVVSSLIDGLATRYPVTQTLVGEEFFRAMASVYVRENPPQSALLMHYGIDFADFIEGFQPASDLPYLPDVARIENARVKAYHAADIAPISPKTLAAQAIEETDSLLSKPLHIHPSVTVLASPYPAWSIWKNHHDLSELQWSSEEILICRPHDDVHTTLAPQGMAEMLAQVQQGTTLNQIWHNTPDDQAAQATLLLQALIQSEIVIP